MKGILAILLLVALALTGCSGKGTTTTSSSSTTTSGGTTTSTTTTTTTSDTTTTATTTTSATTTTTTTTTTTPPPPANRAPVISTLAASRPNATTLTFQFVFMATDPDQNPLNWTLDANGDGSADGSGTTFPGNTTYTYPAQGLYNATLRVSDGKITATRVLAINASLAANNAVLFTASGNTTVPAGPAMLAVQGASPVGAKACTGFLASQSGQDCVFFNIPLPIDGRSFRAVSSAGNADLEFWDSCSAQGTQMASFANAGNEQGTVPANVGCVILWDGTAGRVGTMTITVT